MEMLEVDGVELCLDRRGDPQGPTVLLLAGAAQSMDAWEPELCELLAAPGFQVVRFDQRDTGRSSSWPAGQPGYTSADLVRDPVRILDAMGIGRAHLVGMSMGGGLAQHVALQHPERVASLTLMSSTPVGGGASRGLPPPTSAVMASFEAPLPEPDWGDAAAVVNYRVELERPFAGGLGMDESRLRHTAEREVARTRDMAAALGNHVLIQDTLGAVDPAGIRAPALVVHGVDDPLFPLAHGQALARALGARLLTLDGTGHEIAPPRHWPQVVAAVHELVGVAERSGR